MKRMRIFIAAFLLVAISAVAFVPSNPVGAAAALDGVCANNPDSKVCQNKDNSTDGFVKSLVNTLLFVVGSISVVMIIIGGILYAVSGGDSGSVSKAKNTITYSVVGLVVSFLAYAIINWVLKLFIP